MNEAPADPIKMRASVQSSPGDGMDMNEEGRRRTSEITITTKQPLYAAYKDRNADIVNWNDEEYEVVSAKPWGTGTRLAHFKAVAKSLEDHTDADI